MPNRNRSVSLWKAVDADRATWCSPASCRHESDPVVSIWKVQHKLVEWSVESISMAVERISVVWDNHRDFVRAFQRRDTCDSCGWRLHKLELNWIDRHFLGQDERGWTLRFVLVGRNLDDSSRSWWRPLHSFLSSNISLLDQMFLGQDIPTLRTNSSSNTKLHFELIDNLHRCCSTNSLSSLLWHFQWPPSLLVRRRLWSRHCCLWQWRRLCHKVFFSSDCCSSRLCWLHLVHRGLDDGEYDDDEHACESNAKSSLSSLYSLLNESSSNWHDRPTMAKAKKMNDHQVTNSNTSSTQQPTIIRQTASELWQVAQGHERYGQSFSRSPMWFISTLSDFSSFFHFQFFRERNRIPRISFSDRSRYIDCYWCKTSIQSASLFSWTRQVKCMTYYGNQMTTTNRICMNSQSFGTWFNINIPSNGLQFSDNRNWISSQVDEMQRNSSNLICADLFRQAPGHAFEVFLEIHAPIGRERNDPSCRARRGRKWSFVSSTCNINTISEWFLRWDSEDSRQFCLSISNSFVRLASSPSIISIPNACIEMNKANTSPLLFWILPARPFVSVTVVDPIENRLVYVWSGKSYGWVPGERNPTFHSFSSR